MAVVNLGYLLLSMAKTVEFAIFANDVAYLGSVFLSMCMLLTIVKLCGFEIEKAHVIICITLGSVMFAIIATAGILPWYYKEVSLTFINGSAKLVKEYGTLHNAYLVYLLGYFAAIIVTIIHSIIRKKHGSYKFAGLIAAGVCGEKANEVEHSFGNWTVTKQPTTNEDGSREKSCLCGTKVTESIPATGGEETAEKLAAMGVDYITSNILE